MLFPHFSLYSIACYVLATECAHGRSKPLKNAVEFEVVRVVKVVKGMQSKLYVGTVGLEGGRALFPAVLHSLDAVARTVVICLLVPLAAPVAPARARPFLFGACQRRARRGYEGPKVG